MFQRLSKAVLITISLLSALPAIAGDDRGARHHGFHAGSGLGFNARPFFFPRPVGFAGFRGNHRDRGLGRPLREIYSAQPRYIRNTVIVVPQADAAPANGYYGGSNYAYGANGGTYIAADGYGFYRTEDRASLKPKAKVIYIATAKDPCSYEAGVCVLRP